MRGSWNLLRQNSSSGAPADGIRVVGGTGNRIEECGTRWSGACGILNATTGTTVTGSSFWSSGSDVVNAGTFTSFVGNSFGSGTPDPMPFGGSVEPEDDFGIEGVVNDAWGGGIGGD